MLHSRYVLEIIFCSLMYYVIKQRVEFLLNDNHSEIGHLLTRAAKFVKDVCRIRITAL